MNSPKKIAVIGLGYVGLPLAIEFAKKYPTVGFDITMKRIKELKNAIDTTLEVDAEVLSSVLVPNLMCFAKAFIWVFTLFGSYGYFGCECLYYYSSNANRQK